MSQGLASSIANGWTIPAVESEENPCEGRKPPREENSCTAPDRYAIDSPVTRQIHMTARKGPLKRFLGFLYTVVVRHQAARVGVGLRVWGPTAVSPETEIGDYCNFNGMRIRGHGRVVVGDYFHSGDGCEIITTNHNYRGETLPYDQMVIHKDVTIGPCVWFGSRVIVLGGVTIGEGAIIQAGAVVVRDVPPLAMAGGNPAEVFAWRDREHYERLKAAGRFY
jgi:acetyltransferase-like isoleucine patch superfamily enzyme